MDFNEAKELSPLFKDNTVMSDKDKKRVQVIVAVGKDESPAFITQSINFCKYLKKISFEQIKYLEIEDTDHFNVIENLSDDSFILTKVISFDVTHINNNSHNFFVFFSRKYTS